MSLWIYRCNTGNRNGTHGNWDEFFAGAKKAENGTQPWGGPGVNSQPNARQLGESMQTGQRLLCWQRWSGPTNEGKPRDVAAAAVGIVEFVDRDCDGMWLFRPKQRFSDPVPLLKWRKSSPVIDEIFRVPRQLGTLDELSVAEEQEVLRICSDHLGREEGCMNPAAPSSRLQRNPRSVVRMLTSFQPARSQAIQDQTVRPSPSRGERAVPNEDPGRRVNAAALRADRAWLFGRGLAGEVEELRSEGKGRPIPAPGLLKLLDRLENHLRDVCDLSDQVAILLRDPDQTPDLVARIEIESDAAEEAAAETELVTRRIAQLALGVSSSFEPSERAARLKRAALAALHPLQGTGGSVGIVADGIELFTRNRRDLRVELGGIICRMLIDRNVTVRFGEVELRVGSEEALLLTSSKAERLWDSPVHTSDAAHTIAKALKSMGMSHKRIRATAVAE